MRNGAVLVTCFNIGESRRQQNGCPFLLFHLRVLTSGWQTAKRRASSRYRQDFSTRLVCTTRLSFNAALLCIQILVAGPPGAKKPLPSTPCLCHYKGTLIDGTEFDSSYSRGQPTSFAPNQVVRGWTEAMQLMSEGSKWELYLPADLAYGSSQRGALIKPNSVLVFTLELLKVNGRAQPSDL